MTFKNVLTAIFGDPVKINALRLLAAHERGLTGRGIAAFLQTSPAKAHRVLHELAEQGILGAAVLGRAHVYRVNKGHVLARHVVLPALRFERDILERLGSDMMQRLRPPPVAILLYGSVARGEESPTSDLDLVVICPIARRDIKTQVSELSAWLTRTCHNAAMIRVMSIAEFQQGVAQHRSYARNLVKEGRSIAGLTMTEVLTYGRKSR